MVPDIKVDPRSRSATVPSRHPGGMSTDTLTSTISSRTNSSAGVELSGQYIPTNAYDRKRHKKNGSGNQVMENLFGIYPEQKKLGVGVSVADVVANKLFSWGKNVTVQTPNSIPTPAASKKKSKDKTLPSDVVSKELSPSSAHQSLESIQNDSSYASMGSSQSNSSQGNVAQPKLDDLLARQRQLEEKIQQLKLERTALLELDVDSAVRDYDSREQEKVYPPARVNAGKLQHDIPQTTIAKHRISTVRSYQDRNAEKVRMSRQYQPRPQPQKSTFMASPTFQGDPTAYTTRPLPEVPYHTTPPPEYDQVIPYRSGESPRTCKDMKISFPMPGDIGSHEIILSQPEKPYVADPRPSPRGEEIETEEILGWLDTFSGNEEHQQAPQGRAPMIPLPRPPGDVKHPSAIDPSTYYYGIKEDNDQYILSSKPFEMTRRPYTPGQNRQQRRH